MKIKGSKTIVYFLSIITLCVLSCKKKDSVEPPPQPVTIADSTFKITSIDKDDLTEFDVSYQIAPPKEDIYSSVFLHWSTTPDFSGGKDSISLIQNVSSSLSGTYKISGLTQETKYYTRLSVLYKKHKFYSQAKDFITDKFKITSSFTNNTFPTYANRGMISFLFTNLKHIPTDHNSKAKVFLGNYQCPLISDGGYSIGFTVPKDMPYGRYSLKVERKGLVAQTPDSVIVLKGIWSYPEKPVFPEGANTGPNALGFYGTCFNAQKGYIISGLYKNHLPAGNSPIDINYPNYILEFNGSTTMWTKRFTTNQKNFEEPRCYLYNNTIYVIGGREDLIQDGIWPVKHIWKLDLSTMTWTRGDEVPHKNIVNPISFELNGEWFIGSGVDVKNLNPCCGYPLPTPKMWKYSPSQNTWTPIADFPGRYQAKPTTFTIGDKAYVFSGAIHKGSHDNIYETEFERELWEYTPASNTWTQIPLPEVDSHLILPIGEKYCIFGYNGKAYFLSSQKRIATGVGHQFSPFASFTEFDPQAKTFTRISYPNNYPPMKMFFRNGNKFYFQSDALGDRAEYNETYELLID